MPRSEEKRRPCVRVNRLSGDGVEWHLRTAQDLDETRALQLLARYGLEVPTLGTGLAWGQDGLSFANPEAQVRRQAVERVKGHIRLAAPLRSAGSTPGRARSSDPVGLQPAGSASIRARR